MVSCYLSCQPVRDKAEDDIARFKPVREKAQYLSDREIALRKAHVLVWGVGAEGVPRFADVNHSEGRARVGL